MTLPNLVGLTLDEAQQQLTDLNLAFLPDPQANADVAENVVWATDPPAETLVEVGQSIKLTFNPAAEAVAIENVAGLSAADATAKLQAQGFVVTSSAANDDSVAQGAVIRTEPAAGQQLKQGETVNIVVSAGPNQVTVPSVAGRTQADAVALLRGDPFRFAVDVQTQANASVAAGTVIGTNPQTNAALARGATVVLIVSSGPQPVEVPAVEGKTEADARNAIKAVGLDVAVRYVTVNFGSSDDGKVITQSPDAGTGVDPGSAVRLTVGKAVQPPPRRARRPPRRRRRPPPRRPRRRRPPHRPPRPRRPLTSPPGR